MNELMITFLNGNYIYFNTEQNNADKAFDDFLNVCDNAGMNMDNMDFAFCELRDNKQKTIDMFIISEG